MKLILRALGTFLVGALISGILLFLPAWTFNYWQAWVFIVVFGLATNGIGIYLSLNDPELLERRKKGGPAAETRMAQKILISIAALLLPGVLIFSAFDYRFGWSPVPGYISWLGDLLIVCGLFVDLLVFRENSYGGSSIEIVQGQKVISTGLYAIVRHPMYVGVLIMIIGMPLALDSWWGLLVLVPGLIALVLRVIDEEDLLQKDLPGYTDYTRRVHYRLVPYIW